MSVVLIGRRSRHPDDGTGHGPDPLWQAVSRFAAAHGETTPRREILEDEQWLDPCSASLVTELESVAGPGDWLVTAAPADLISSCRDLEETVLWLTGHQMNWYDLSLRFTLTDPHARVDFRALLSSLARMERLRAGERVRDVKRHQRRKGRYLGGSRPFGYMIHENGRLIENPMEQRVLKHILRLRRKGLSLRAIADQVSTPLTPVSFKTVQRILQRHV